VETDIDVIRSFKDWVPTSPELADTRAEALTSLVVSSGAAQRHRETNLGDTLPWVLDDPLARKKLLEMETMNSPLVSTLLQEVVIAISTRQQPSEDMLTAVLRWTANLSTVTVREFFPHLIVVSRFLMEDKPLAQIAASERETLFVGFLYRTVIAALDEGRCGRFTPEMFLGCWNDPFVMVAERVLKTASKSGGRGPDLAAVSKVATYLSANKRSRSFLEIMLREFKEAYSEMHRIDVQGWISWSLSSAGAPQVPITIMSRIAGEMELDVNDLFARMFKTVLFQSLVPYPGRLNLLAELVIRQRLSEPKSNARLTKALTEFATYRPVGETFPFWVFVPCVIAVRWPGRLGDTTAHVDHVVATRLGLSVAFSSRGIGSVWLIQSILVLCSAKQLSRLRRGETCLPTDLLRRLYDFFKPARQQSPALLTRG